MKVWKSEMLAVSRAGHDRDTLYVVLEEDDTYLWLVDGKRRLLDKPKKKKKIHVQVIKHLPQELHSAMQAISLDAHVRRILKQYSELGTLPPASS